MACEVMAYTATAYRVMDHRAMAYGLDRLLPFLQHTQDGYTYQLTRWHFITWSQDCKVNSLDKSTPMPKISKVHWITGFMKAQMMSMSGHFLSKCGDGLNGMMDAIWCSPISPRLAGTMFQTVDLAMKPILVMENLLQSMSITTTSTLTYTNSPEKQEALRVQITDNSCHVVSSVMNQSGE